MPPVNLSIPTRRMRNANVTQGVGTTVGGINPGDRGQAGQGLSDQFPETFMLPCGFTKVPVAAGTPVPANSGIWELLAINPADNSGQDVILYGAEIEQSPPDVAGTAGGIAGNTTPLAWGNACGEGAALVIGRNLQTVTGAWANYAAPFAGVEAGTSQGVTSENLIDYTIFPSGQYNGTTQGREWTPLRFQPFAEIFTPGQPIRVGLVMQGSKVVAGATNAFYGFASIKLRFARVTAFRSWSRR